MSVLEVSDATFSAEVLRSPLPVLVDLYTPTCAPCRTLAPVVAEVAKEVEGRAKVVKCDVSRHLQVAQMFQVRQVPFLAVLVSGKLVAHQLGAVPKAALLRLLEPFMTQDESAIGARELFRLITEGAVVPIDIRDAGSFSRYRIPGAIHLAEADLEAHKVELLPSDGRKRVLYGRADEGRAAAKRLAGAGVAVAFLKDGFLGWESENLDVDRG